MKKAIIVVLFLVVVLSMFVYAETSVGEIDPAGISGSVELSKGWNLVTVYGIDLDLLDVRGNSELLQELEEKGIEAIFLYDSYNHKYIQLYPNAPEKEEQVRAFLSHVDWEETGDREEYASFTNAALWVYTTKEATLNFETLDGPFYVDYVKLKQGWNFLAVTPDLVGKTLPEIAGNCKIEKAYFWNRDIDGRTGWSSVTETNNRIDQGNVWYGFIIKVSNSCKLGDKDFITPPSIPEDDSTPSCKDSDGGKNLFSKGTLVVQIDGKTVTESDSCAYDATPDDSSSIRYIANKSCSAGPDCYVQELACTYDIPEDYSESFACPQGCNNGACLS